MNLLKQNLFLVCLSLGTLVVGGGLLKMYSGYTSEGRRRIALRTDASGKIRRLTDKPLVNPAILAHAKDRVEKMKEIRERVAREFLDRNRAGREVMAFEGAGKDGKALPAFPIDADAYYTKGLRLQFATIYRQQLDEICKELKPTWAPSTEEIQAEAAAIAERTAPLPATPIAPVATPRSAVTPRTNTGMSTDIYGPMGPGMIGPMPPPPGGRVTRRYSTPTPSRYSATPTPAPAVTPGGEAAGPAELTPLEKAQGRLVSRQAGAGEVYADPATSLYAAVTPSPTPIGDDAILWQAQLSLWIQQDIAAAIRQTNKGYRDWHGGKGHDKGVPSSAVKRLISTRVLGYVVNRTSTGARGAMGDMGMGMGMSSGRTSGSSGSGGTAKNLAYLDAGTGAPGSSGTGGSVVPKLTGRCCNPIYDVVDYEFTAIVAATELVRLEKSLMAQNNHTILRVETSQMGAKGERASGGRGMGMGVSPMTGAGTALNEDLFYYGTDPVVQVRIVGELLMLTDWTRGREKAATDASPAGGSSAGRSSSVAGGKSTIVWDENYPPLMPVKVLQNISGADPSAMREVDRRRIQAEGTTPAAPSPSGMGMY